MIAHDYNSGLSKDVRSEEDLTFEDFLLDDKTLAGLKKCGFQRPSPIQIETIPIGRCGFDLIIQSKAGTGKTCIFTIIALEILKFNINKNTQTLIVAPTREIAIQIHEVVSKIGICYEELRCAIFIGGIGVHQDKLQLAKKAQIVIGTPGRIKHLIEDKILNVKSIELLVLDEVDKLMDDQFKIQIDAIFRHLPFEKQLIVTSATYPNELAEFLRKKTRAPKFIRFGSDISLEAIEEQYLECKAGHSNKKTLENKFKLLKTLLRQLDFVKCLIFTNFQARAPQICDHLNDDSSFSEHLGSISYLCSELSQDERTCIFNRFKTSDQKLLVSTDISARGIDIEGVDLVINLDLPHDNATYYHRIGRAGRFGRPGRSISMVSSEESDQKIFKKLSESDKRMTKFNLTNDDDHDDKLI